jgi:uncharacterized membrane protein (DUF106 family)
VVQRILDENAYLRDLSVGTLETDNSRMPDYDEAIAKLQEKAKEAKEKENDSE